MLTYSINLNWIFDWTRFRIEPGYVYHLSSPPKRARPWEDRTIQVSIWRKEKYFIFYQKCFFLLAWDTINFLFVFNKNPKKRQIELNPGQNRIFWKMIDLLLSKATSSILWISSSVIEYFGCSCNHAHKATGFSILLSNENIRFVFLEFSFSRFVIAKNSSMSQACPSGRPNKS